MSYFFLGSVLSPLNIGTSLETQFDDLILLLKENMSSHDFTKILQIRTFIDLQNIKKLLQGASFLDTRGNMTKVELQEALVRREELPELLYEYLDKYDQSIDRIRYFSQVFLKFFQEIEYKEKNFLSFYFNFEKELRLLMTALRSKYIGRDLTQEIQYEDVYDSFIADMLVDQKNHCLFEFPVEYKDFGEQLKQAKDCPMNQHQVVTKYRFNHIQNKIQYQPYTLDYVLGYFVQFMLVQDWNQLTNYQENHKLNELVKELG